ncbi:hypothetical protein DYU05_08895 [Mucilaginibacter terrenus]|uniref:Uncharacterized protein n=1 Tax=Mucilaginibacter terrenus TaxID=2482727 RepID=A0A3E2NXE6_9SPHI|nr:hypothetical protein DYU05_08895 [Mucilaginibacter terrenus]
MMLLFGKRCAAKICYQIIKIFAERGCDFEITFLYLPKILANLHSIKTIFRLHIRRFFIKQLHPAT